MPSLERPAGGKTVYQYGRRQKVEIVDRHEYERRHALGGTVVGGLAGIAAGTLTFGGLMAAGMVAGPALLYGLAALLAAAAIGALIGKLIAMARDAKFERDVVTRTEETPIP